MQLQSCRLYDIFGTYFAMYKVMETNNKNSKFHDIFNDEPVSICIELTQGNYLFLQDESVRLSQFQNRQVDIIEIVNFIIAEFRTN